MKVYAVIYSVGLSSGYNELVGVYSTIEKAEEIKKTDMKRRCRNDWHYSITPITIDKTVNEVYQEW